MNLAIFDLDKTLLEGDSDHAWGIYATEVGLVDKDYYQKENDKFFAQYDSGNLDLGSYLEFVLSILRAAPLHKLYKIRDNYIQEVVIPMLRPRIVAILEEHKKLGDKVIIITATNDFLADPLKDILGLDEVIATSLEVNESGFTGKITKTPSFQGGKIVRLEQWQEETGFEFEKITFYSDSHNDLPLLKKVDEPIAVTPDPQLRSIAEELGWKIID